MDRVYAWVEGRQERNIREFYRILEQGRRVWTPNNIFNRCCVKWLVDGDDRRYDVFDEYSPRRGCNGRRCNRDHPTIILRFDAAACVTIATISHRLDPFVRCLNNLDGAWPHSSTVWRITGYLRPVETALHSRDTGFGGNLVKVEPGSREASDAAQAAELEMVERAKNTNKRRRVNGDDQVGDTKPFIKLEEVICIVAKHCNMHNDALTLFCMRPVCKLFHKIATSIASLKMKTLNLSITPLVNGTMCYGYDQMSSYDEETGDLGTWDVCEGDFKFSQYSKKSVVSLICHSLEEAEIEDGWYHPVNTEDATFDWDSGELLRDAEEYQDDHDNAEWAEYAYSGQLMRVFWHPSPEDRICPPGRTDCYAEIKPSLGVRIGEFYLQRPPNCGNVTQSQKGITISYEVLESNTSETEEEEEEEEEEEMWVGNIDEEGISAGSNIRRTRRYIKYSGKIALGRVKVDFGVLVRAHACKVNGELCHKYINILKERPLTPAEKEYKTFVELASG